jgi:uncharacterized membrane protein YozB (DUF420 family)
MDWISLILFFTSMTAASGFLQGVFSARIWDVVIGLIVFPITATLMSAAFISLIVMGFAFFYERYVSWHRCAEVAAFAAVPYFVLHPFSAWLPLVDLVGFGLACYFLVIGISRNLNIFQDQVMRIIGAIYFLFFLIWLSLRFFS